MFKLEFSTDNAAFGDDCPQAVAEVLREVARKVAVMGDGAAVVRDANGNRIGSWELNVKQEA